MFQEHQSHLDGSFGTLAQLRENGARGIDTHGFWRLMSLVALILMLRRSVLWDLWHEGVWSSGWYSTRQSRLAVSCHEVYGRGGAFLNFIPLPLLQVIQESVDDSLPLLAHLIKPVQRVIKYKQFLEVSQFKFSMQSLIVQLFFWYSANDQVQ